MGTRDDRLRCEINLLLAEPCDIDERLRSTQHGKQTQQQHLFEWIDHFSALARIGKVLEIFQKNNGFADRPKIPCSLFLCVPQFASEDHYRFSTSSLCLALLRPIALANARTVVAEA
jgi:hypothetical protein